MPNEHAARTLQPSGFKRTMNCPGWGQFCEREGIAPKPSGKYAAEGSVAHFLGEACLNTGKEPHEYVGGSGIYNAGVCTFDISASPPSKVPGEYFVFDITNDMADGVKVYTDEVRRKLAATVGAALTVESRLDLGYLVPGMHGTGDAVIVEPLGRLYVDDLKFGQGVAVEVGTKPGDNEQLTIYALGALGDDNPHMVEEVVVTITQPRAIHPAGPIRSIRYNVDELIAWGIDVLVPAAKASIVPGAPLLPGSWCKWCDAEGICPALRKQALEAADIMFDPEGVPFPPARQSTPQPPQTMSKEQMDQILAVTGQVETWLKAIKAEAYSRLENGNPEAPTTFKLVAGKLSNRAWADEDKVYDRVKTFLPRKEVYVEKVLSPAQMDKTLKRVGKRVGSEIVEILAPLLQERKPGAPSMVPAGDARKALPPRAEIMFNE